MESPGPADRLLRRLGLADAVAVFVGAILGSGIFIAPQLVAAAAPGAWGLLPWAAGAVVALCGAFCYAECGARLPQAGGFYVFYRHAHGPAAAFVAGWVGLVVTYPASIAAIAHVLADHATQLVPAAAGHEALIACAAVAAAAAPVAAGVRAGALAQRVLTATKFLALLLLCAAAVLFGGSPASSPPAAAEPGSWTVLLGAMVVVLWTYDGWSDVTLLSGEIRDPARNLSRAVLLGVLALAALYAVTQLSVVALLPADRASASTRVVADAVEAGLGTGAGRLVAALVVVATFGAIQAVIFTSSRLAFAMARDGTFPSMFASVDVPTGAPRRAVLAVVLAAIVYAALSGFRDLLGLFTFAVWIFYGLTAVALLRLRARGVGEPLSWRAPGGPIAPAVVLLTGTAMTVSLFRESPMRSAAGLGVMAAGFAVHAAWRARRRHARLPES